MMTALYDCLKFEMIWFASIDNPEELMRKDELTKHIL